MPAPGRRTPRTYKPAAYYLERIPILHPDQGRLKAQLTSIFHHEENGADLIARIKEELSDGLLVSREVVLNPNVYEFLLEALES